jgi:hypothetical protein
LHEIQRLVPLMEPVACCRFAIGPLRGRTTARQSGKEKRHRNAKKPREPVKVTGGNATYYGIASPKRRRKVYELIRQMSASLASG